MWKKLSDFVLDEKKILAPSLKVKWYVPKISQRNQQVEMYLLS